MGDPVLSSENQIGLLGCFEPIDVAGPHWLKLLG
jgi:hypothetical protein